MAHPAFLEVGSMLRTPETRWAMPRVIVGTGGGPGAKHQTSVGSRAGGSVAFSHARRQGERKTLKVARDLNPAQVLGEGACWCRSRE